MPEPSPRRPLGHSPPSTGDDGGPGKRPKSSTSVSLSGDGTFLSFDSTMDELEAATNGKGGSEGMHSLFAADRCGDPVETDAGFPIPLSPCLEKSALEFGPSVRILDVDQVLQQNRTDGLCAEQSSSYFPGEPLKNGAFEEDLRIAKTVRQEEESMSQCSSLETLPAEVVAEVSSSTELSCMMDENLSMNSPKTSTQQSETENSASVVEKPEVVLSGTDIPHDWNEDCRDRKKRLQVFFMLNGCTEASATFTVRRFVVTFKTSDEAFLTNKSRGLTADKDTLFRYNSGILFEDVVPEKCTVKLNHSRKGIEVYLEKAVEKFWTALCVSHMNTITTTTSKATPPPETMDPHKSPLKTHADDVGVGIPNLRDELDEEDLLDVNDNDDSLSRPSSPIGLHSPPEDYARFRSLLPSTQPTPSTASTSYLYPDLLRWPSSTNIANSSIPVPVMDPSPYYGYTGVNNMGNTCYLGAVIQCLANTKELRDYFLYGHYKREVNKRNPLGTKGRFAGVIEETFRLLWKGERTSFSPTSLRMIMSRMNDQFNGYGQQDAHEAMAFVIDSLHEDLNRVSVKPYLNEIESNERPDEEIARQTWEYHLSRDNSAIHDLFTGMFKSTVECPECNKKNIKFDPYQIMAVPVPKFGVIIDCYFFPRDYISGKKPLRFRMNFNREHSIGYHYPQLQSHLADVAMSQVRILGLRDMTCMGVLDKDYECLKLDESCHLLLYEVLTEKSAKEPVKDFCILQYEKVRKPAIQGMKCGFCGEKPEILKRCLFCEAVGYCGKKCQLGDWGKHRAKCRASHGSSVGVPFVFSLRVSQLKYHTFLLHLAKHAVVSVSYYRQRSVRRAASCTSEESLSPTSSPLVLPETEAESGIAEGKSPCPTPSASDGDSGVGSSCSTTSEEASLWDPQEAGKKSLEKGQGNAYPFSLVPLERLAEPWDIYPRCDEIIKSAANLEEALSVNSVFVLLWHNSTTKDTSVRCESRQLETDTDPSCDQLKKERERHHGYTENVSLHHCIELLTQPEVLSKVNAWMCPTCKLPREASKKFEIWSLPTVLVFQLKRFSKPSGEVWRRDKIDTMVDYPLKGLDMSTFLVGPGDGGDYIYDLYGVVNHRGSTWYGHYVALIRCYNVPNTDSDEVGWRACDDENVEPEDNLTRLVDRGAYLLFYRRRGTPNPILIPSLDDSDSPDDYSDENGANG